jgi:hypothetical protein
MNYYSFPHTERMNTKLGIRVVMFAIDSPSCPFIIPEKVWLFQNIFNQKIYIVLWFWYAFLGPVSVLFVFYRLFTIFFSGILFSLLYRTVSRQLLDFAYTNFVRLGPSLSPKAKGLD